MGIRFELAERLAQRATEGQISPEDLDIVIDWPNDELITLFAATDQVRKHFHGKAVDPCSLMNVKAGGCSEDCTYCAQSAHNKADIKVQPLAETKEIVRQANHAHQMGSAFCVVSSGKRLDSDEIKQLADAIRNTPPEKHASLGILSDEQFQQLVDAGVTCYNHNLETSSAFFSKVCTTHGYADRVATVKRAKAAGLKVCSGGIFGLGESWKDRKELCLALRELDVDVVPLNFLNPIPGIRAEKPTETALDFLKIVALFRLALPTKIIKVCGGRELHLGKLQGLMFYAGANGFILGNYLTTSGDEPDSDFAMVAALGLAHEKSLLRPIDPHHAKTTKPLGHSAPAARLRMSSDTSCKR